MERLLLGNLEDKGTNKTLVRPSSLIGWWFFFTFEILEKRVRTKKWFLLVFICNFALKKEVDMQLRFDWWRWLVTILVGFFIMLMLYGCRTTRYVEVEKVVRDTTTYAHWDSIVNERVKLIRDSLLSYHWEQTEKQVKDSTYIKDDVKTRIDESGKVLGKDSTHIEIRYRNSKELSKVRDSLIHYKEIAERASIYKAQRDSLNRELSITQTKKEYIEKDLVGWDLFYWKFGMISFWVVSLTLIAMIFFLTIKYKKKFFH